MKIKDSFHTYANITVVFWSLAYVFTRLALRYFSAFSLGFIRYVVASCTLLAIILTAKVKPPQKKDLKYFALAGGTGFFLYMIVFNIGSITITSATSSVVIATSPIITAILASAFYKERLTPIQWASTIVSFLGVVALTLLDGTFTISIGLVYMFCASVLISIYNVLQRHLNKTYTALQSCAFSMFFGTLLLCIFAPAAVPEAVNAPAIQWLYILVLGIFSSAVGFLSWSKALAIAKYTSSVSNYMFVTPFLTALLAWIIAGETPTFATVIGGVIILSGLFLFRFGDRMYEKLRTGSYVKDRPD